MAQKNISGPTAQKLPKPVFSQALHTVINSLELKKSLAPFNTWEDSLHETHERIRSCSIRNWLLGRSRPTAYNYSSLKEIFAKAIESRKSLPILDMRMLSEGMKKLLPSDSEDIERYAEQYYRAEADAKAKNEVTEEVVNAAKEAVFILLGRAYNTKGTEVPEEIPAVAAPAHEIEVTVFSPVNVRVFLNGKSHPLMYVDLNSGLNYRTNRVRVQGDFDLIFSSKGFTKRVRFPAGGLTSIEYDLGAILTSEEIGASYDRAEALAALSSNEPTGYLFETLAKVGTCEDLGQIAGWLEQWTQRTVSDRSVNYQIALACSAIGNLSVRYRDDRYLCLVEEIYEGYQAKSSYGYMIENALRKLYSYFGT